MTDSVQRASFIEANELEVGGIVLPLDPLDGGDIHELTDRGVYYITAPATGRYDKTFFINPTNNKGDFIIDAGNVPDVGWVADSSRYIFSVSDDFKGTLTVRNLTMAMPSTANSNLMNIYTGDALASNACKSVIFKDCILCKDSDSSNVSPIINLAGACKLTLKRIELYFQLDNSEPAPIIHSDVRNGSSVSVQDCYVNTNTLGGSGSGIMVINREAGDIGQYSFFSITDTVIEGTNTSPSSNFARFTVPIADVNRTQGLRLSRVKAQLEGTGFLIAFNDTSDSGHIGKISALSVREGTIEDDELFSMLTSKVTDRNNVMEVPRTTDTSFSNAASHTNSLTVIPENARRTDYVIINKPTWPYRLTYNLSITNEGDQGQHATSIGLYLTNVSDNSTIANSSLSMPSHKLIDYELSTLRHYVTNGVTLNSKLLTFQCEAYNGERVLSSINYTAYTTSFGEGRQG